MNPKVTSKSLQSNSNPQYPKVTQDTPQTGRKSIMRDREDRRRVYDNDTRKRTNDIIFTAIIHYNCNFQRLPLIQQRLQSRVGSIPLEKLATVLVVICMSLLNEFMILFKLL